MTANIGFASAVAEFGMLLRHSKHASAASFESAAARARLFKGADQLNRFVNVYLNDEDIRHLQKLETPVKAGDEVSIVPAIAGGVR